MYAPSDKKVLVIGAGPAGITAAYQLAKAGLSVEVIEASDAAGGMARSISLWGQTVDLGPHRFFSSDRKVNELWLEVVQRDYAMVNRQTRIFYKDRFFSYPLRPLDTFFKLGFLESFGCGLSYLMQRLAPEKKTADTFESWVVGRFGRRLFEIFFRPYSEKLWGIPCDELDSDFAAQRIKKLSFWEVLKNAVKAGRGNRHKSLVDRFAYPFEGSGIVYSRMAKKVQDTPGCSIRYGTKVGGVVLEGNRVVGVRLSDGTIRRADWVISTMPLTQMVKSIPKLPPSVLAAAESLTFRNTILVYVRVKGKNLFPDQWLYVQSPELQMGRVTNFRNWVPSLYGDSEETILAVEYWCYDKDPVWTAGDASTGETAIRELGATGLLGGSEVLDTKVIRIPRCYPVYRRGYKDHLKVVTSFLDTIQGLVPIGRYGAFKYNNQDHSILMGLLAAESIVEGASRELWGINTDYESYQEETRIDETGLDKAA